MFIMSPKELAPSEDQGVIFGIIDAAANATLDQTQPLCRRGQRGLSEHPGNRLHLSDHLSDIRALEAWWPQALGGARPHRLCRFFPRCSRKLSGIPGIRMFPVTPPALPGGGQFPVEFVLTSTAETRT